MGQWHQIEGVQHLVERLAQTALRTQRILIGQRINQLEAMVKIHAPSLLKDPAGEEKLKAMYDLCAKARQALKEKPRG
jgi:hypothetical protein